MPTYDAPQRFLSDYSRLSPEEQAAFNQAVGEFVEDLKSGLGFRNSLRVKGVQGYPKVFEMTWAGDGRATFSYGTSPHQGEPHIIWRRIGTHTILKNP